MNGASERCAARFAVRSLSCADAAHSPCAPATGRRTRSRNGSVTVCRRRCARSRRGACRRCLRRPSVVPDVKPMCVGARPLLHVPQRVDRRGLVLGGDVSAFRPEGDRVLSRAGRRFVVRGFSVRRCQSPSSQLPSITHPRGCLSLCMKACLGRFGAVHRSRDIVYRPGEDSDRLGSSGGTASGVLAECCGARRDGRGPA